jgi:hypothetical protein
MKYQSVYPSLLYMQHKSSLVVVGCRFSDPQHKQVNVERKFLGMLVSTYLLHLTTDRVAIVVAHY